MSISVGINGLTFISENSRSHYDWISVVLITVVLGFCLLILSGILRRYRENHRGNWITVNAKILRAEGDEEPIGVNPQRGSRGAIGYPEYKIEYRAGGKKYVKIMPGNELIGCIDEVEIQYLEKRPGNFRKKVER